MEGSISDLSSLKVMIEANLGFYRDYKTLSKELKRRLQIPIRSIGSINECNFIDDYNEDERLRAIIHLNERMEETLGSVLSASAVIFGLQNRELDFSQSKDVVIQNIQKQVEVKDSIIKKLHETIWELSPKKAKEMLIPPLKDERK